MSCIKIAVVLLLIVVSFLLRNRASYAAVAAAAAAINVWVFVFIEKISSERTNKKIERKKNKQKYTWNSIGFSFMLVNKLQFTDRFTLNDDRRHNLETTTINALKIRIKFSITNGQMFRNIRANWFFWRGLYQIYKYNDAGTGAEQVYLMVLLFMLRL